MQSSSDSDDVSPALLANALGDYLRREYARSQDATYLDQAVVSYREACETGGAESDYGRSVFFNNLAGMLGERFRRRGELADLEEAVTAYEAADRLTPEDSVYKKMIKSNLGLCLQDLFDRSEDVRHIIGSAQNFGAALALSEPGEEARGIARMQAAVAERAYRLANDPVYLDWSIAAFEIASGGLAELKRPQEFLGRFADLLMERYELHGQADDVERAIARLEQMLGHRMPANARLRPLAVLGRLCNICLRVGYPAGAAAKQSAVIDEIAGLLSFATPEEIGAVMRLGIECNDLFTATGRIEQLTRAIKCFEALAAALPTDHASFGSLMSNLGNALGDRYLRTRSRDDLERGLGCHRAAIDVLTGPDRAAALTNLGTHLMHVYHRTDDMQHLQQAIEAHRESIAATDASSSLLPARLDNLGASLAERYDDTRAWADLHESVALHEQALSLLAPPSEVRIGILYNLALRVAERAEAEGDASGEDRSWSLFRQACVEGLNVGIAEALRAARNWINLAFEKQRWELVADAYGYFDEAATRLVGTQELRQDKEAWLRELVDVGARAAYAFARQGDCNSAVMCLEHGAARLLSEALRARASGEESVRPSSRTSFAEVCVAARRAPIAYLCCTLRGSLALIVRGTGEVSPLWIDALDAAALRSALVGRDGNGGYLNAYRRSTTAPGDAVALSNWRLELESIARWEGGVVLQPLLDRLDGCDRAVIVAFGALSMLPWQAGVLAQSEAGASYLLDRLQVTYAPNAAALRGVSDDDDAVGGSGESLLTVVDPRPSSAAPLPYAMLEVRACGAHFEQAAMLTKEDATWPRVLDGIAATTVFHFAGHAHANVRTPLRSGLTVAGDVTLALEDILPRSHRGRLAVLSACETSIAGVELPEESVSLSTGFLQFGFRGVIASQWAVADVSTFLLMTRFYALWRRDGLDPAEALRQAQRWLRDSTPPQLIAHLDEQVDKTSGQTALKLRARLNAMPKSSTPFSSPLYWAAFAYWGS